MAGKVILVGGLTKAVVLANPNVLFAFDDNLKKVGFAGQAIECRGCVNTVGIPTKLSPTEYLFDSDVDRVKIPIINSFSRLRQHLRAGNDIAWPKDGVGRDNVSRLYITGPRILEAIEGVSQKVFAEASTITKENVK